MAILDVTTPAKPVRVGGYDTPHGAAHVQVVGRTAYVSQVEAPIAVLDVTHPGQPALLSTFLHNAKAVQLVGNLAYVVGEGFLQIWDVSEPLKPRRVGSIEAGPVADLQMVGGLAYLVQRGEPETGGLWIYDVSDPGRPFVVSYTPHGYTTGVQVVGKLAFLVSGP